MQKLLIALSLMLAGNMAVVPLSAPGLVAVTSAPVAHADHSGLITAHRGSSESAPENTLSAMLQAIEDGAGYGELDVQESADGVLFVMHDDSLQRTTGMNKMMWEARSDELKQLGAGAWFGKSFASEKVPTLEQVMQGVKGRLKLNIELKNNGHQKQLVEQTVRLIHDNGFANDCTVTSFDASLLKKVKSIDKQIKTGLIVGKKPDDLNALLDSDAYEVLSVAYPLVDAAFVRAAYEHRKELYVWTVNDPAVMGQMLDYGVSSIITNRPTQLKRLIETRQTKL